MEENPFRENLISRSRPAPCTLIIFGATGDLTNRKLVPALYNIAMDDSLAPRFKVIGFARREKDDATFRKELEAGNRNHSRQAHDDTFWQNFEDSIHYHQSEFEDLEGYLRLKERLDELDRERGTPANRLFYLASAPAYFDKILFMLRDSGLNQPTEGCWARVVCEKPFGTDLPSAQHLNRVVGETFQEEDTYRIDHYLGKETAQNIMVLRFANMIFEPLWRDRYIDHVQITCAENLGMEGGRGGYYDSAGALRDMVQNHLLQLLSLVAMEPPSDLSADAVRDEKVKVLKSLRHWTSPEDVAANVIRAQYTPGSVDGIDRPGYRQEDRVDPESKTETYVAIRLFIDTWRWDGVPFYIRVGKRLPKKATEISIHFKETPQIPFDTRSLQASKNVLVIRIQPDEGISLRMLAKVPGTTPRIEPVKMDFRYSTSFGKASPEAYERLLLDSMAGDATLFARRDEVENAWAFVDKLENAWHGNHGKQPPMAEYPAGSWGPREADQLLEGDGRVWRRL